MFAMAKDNSSSLKSDEPFFASFLLSVIYDFPYFSPQNSSIIMYMIHQDESKTDKSYFNIDIRYIAVSRCVILLYHFNKIEKKSDY